jgi:hypothetical protein
MDYTLIANPHSYFPHVVSEDPTPYLILLVWFLADCPIPWVIPNFHMAYKCLKRLLAEWTKGTKDFPAYRGIYPWHHEKYQA